MTIGLKEGDELMVVARLEAEVTSEHNFCDCEWEIVR
jgi:hypothetical protein